MKKMLTLFLTFIIAFGIYGCTYANINSHSKSSKIVSTLNNKNVKDILSLPNYTTSSNKEWQIDIRGKDLSKLNLEKRENDLLHSDFDSRTIWPQKLPDKFNPNKIIDISKNPGLDIKKLHSLGITGKNINIAIIDGWMPNNHVEYSKQLKSYHIYVPPGNLLFHGAAVTSIAVGKNTGVAPGSNLYYIGTNNSNNGKVDFSGYAKAIYEIIAFNKNIDNKIRVISISSAWTPKCIGYTDINKAIKKAISENIFVVSPNMFEYYKFYFHGIEIDSLQDRDKPDNYHVVAWDKWIHMANNITKFGDYYEQNIDKVQPPLQLLVPIGCKTVASQSGEDAYTFLSTSGWSWAVPYIAGLYALGCQVDPKVTPKMFWSIALRTGELRLINKGKLNYIGKVVNPMKIINELRK